MSTDWKNLALYSPCKLKQANMYLCMPPLGTVVINKIEHPETIRSFNGKSYFLAREVKAEQAKDSEIYKRLCKAVNTKCACVTTKEYPFVISGVLGEMSVKGLNDLNDYRLLSTGLPCTLDSLRSTGRFKCNALDWVAVQTISFNVTRWACFIPKKEVFQLKTANSGVVTVNNVNFKQHGKGDFIILPDNHGKPSLNLGVQVCNGAVFALSYKQQGWQDCINTAVTSVTTKPNIDLCDFASLKQDEPVYCSLETFKSKCYTFMKCLSELYQFEIVDFNYSVLSSYENNQIGVKFKNETFAARYKIKGLFYGKFKLNMFEEDEKHVMAYQSTVTFLMQSKIDRGAIVYFITPCLQDRDLATKLTFRKFFPLDSEIIEIDSKITSLQCKEGSLNNVNCSIEAKTLLETSKLAFLDSRIANKPVIKFMRLMDSYISQSTILDRDIEIGQRPFDFEIVDNLSTAVLGSERLFFKICENQKTNSYDIYIHTFGLCSCDQEAENYRDLCALYYANKGVFD
jgi:hypothetical protein